ncbi:MAG: hypothetical protein KY428_10425, partial [Bacteroidetes bacterium]|nr:hypothetical protein [Bacteroidota bacterium]
MSVGDAIRAHRELLKMPSVAQIDQSVLEVQEKVSKGYNWLTPVFVDLDRRQMLGDYVPTPRP